jgi:hypothetical protein
MQEDRISGTEAQTPVTRPSAPDPGAVRRYGPPARSLGR